jgi:hypothetical protein
MASKKHPPPAKPKTTEQTENTPTLSADEVMRRALNVRRPPGGWPWEQKPKGKKK